MNEAMMNEIGAVMLICVILQGLLFTKYKT